MNAARMMMGVLIAVAGFGGVVVHRQGGELTALRAERQRLEAEATMRSEVLTQEQAVAPAPTGTPLGPNQKLELMRLRSRVTELSETKRRMARVWDEHVALREQATAVSNLVARRFPPGWVRRSDARVAGTATPEAAFETFVWAVEHRDTNVLFRVLSPEMHETLAREWAKGAEEFWKVSSMIPGFRILQVDRLGDEETRLVVETLPGVPSPEVKAYLVDGQWRIRL